MSSNSTAVLAALVAAGMKAEQLWYREKYGNVGDTTSSSQNSTATVDSRDNQTENVTISMSDYDKNHATPVTVVGTSSDDNFVNYGKFGKLSVIFGGDGDDTISNTQNYVSILGGAGDDSIKSTELYSVMGTIYGGTGNDTIELHSDKENNVIYVNGDGDDTVTGWNSNNTLYIEGDYTRSTVDSSVVFYVGNGSITFTDIVNKYYEKTINVETVPAGTFSSAVEPVYSAPTSTATTSGSSSSSVTSGSSSTSVTNGSSSTSVTSGSSSSSVTSGSSSTSTTTGGGSSSSVTSGSSSSSATGVGSSSTITASQNIYTGGDKTISNYSGQAVTLGAYTGANFNGNNFVVNSPTGSLVIENVTDKIIDLRDGAGGEFIKAYQASSAGGIDGRGLAGYEIIQGSAAGTDVIFAGDGGSQLWGGSGFDADALVGGNGSDIFIGGRYQGNDIFFNASSADAVNLTDTSLSDIVAAVESGGTIAIAFNTGNAITIQSTELLSAAINLADGTSWRYNHSTKSWQGA